MSCVNEITMLLEELSGISIENTTGCRSSERLFLKVYAELRKLAEARLRNERSGQSLQPTALVHEVYLRLVAPNSVKNWDNAGHFFAAAAQAMRRILIDNARKRVAAKRTGGQNRVEFQLDQAELPFRDERLLDLDEALEELAQNDPLKARLVELRFFAGLSIEESCHILGISRTSAHRYWKIAQAWLYLKLNG